MSSDVIIYQHNLIGAAYLHSCRPGSKMCRLFSFYFFLASSMRAVCTPGTHTSNSDIINTSLIYLINRTL